MSDAPMTDGPLVRLNREGLSVTAERDGDRSVEITVLGTAEVATWAPPALAGTTAWEGLRVERAALQCLVWNDAGHLVFVDDTSVDLDFGATTPLAVRCRYSLPFAAADAGRRVELRIRCRAYDVFAPFEVELAAVAMRWRVHPSLVPESAVAPPQLPFGLYAEREPVDDRGQLRFDVYGACPMRPGMREERVVVEMTALGARGESLWREDSSSDVWGGAQTPFSVRFYPEWRPMERAARLRFTVRPQVEGVDAPTVVPMPDFT